MYDFKGERLDPLTMYALKKLYDKSLIALKGSVFEQYPCLIKYSWIRINVIQNVEEVSVFHLFKEDVKQFCQHLPTLNNYLKLNISSEDQKFIKENFQALTSRDGLCHRDYKKARNIFKRVNLKTYGLNESPIFRALNVVDPIRIDWSWYAAVYEALFMNPKQTENTSKENIETKKITSDDVKITSPLGNAMRCEDEKFFAAIDGATIRNEIPEHLWIFMDKAYAHVRNAFEPYGNADLTGCGAAIRNYIDVFGWGRPTVLIWLKELEILCVSKNAKVPIYFDETSVFIEGTLRNDLRKRFEEQAKKDKPIF